MYYFSVAQMNSQDDIEQNINVIESLIQQAKAKHSHLIVFPENFICFAAGKQQQTAQRYEEFKQKLESFAHRYEIWIIAGTLPCPFRPNGSIISDGRVRTVSLCISPEGTEARYDKIHLFDVQVDDAVGGYQESRFFEAGNEPVIVKTPFGQIGMMVCYDLRFPELALQLRQLGANILSAPSAFTFKTGQLHWQLLLQARALDTQSQVLGAAQQGWHGPNRQTWGHAAITNSSGQLLDMIHTEGSGLITVPFNIDEQNRIRQAMPLMQHRKLLNF